MSSRERARSDPTNKIAPLPEESLTSCFDSIPVELHGHQKKLRFIWTSIERLRTQKRQERNQVRVLEVGCSNGRNIASPLARYGYAVTGIDIHLESIEYARRLTPLASAQFLCQKLSDLAPSEKFEIVVLSDVLEHVDDPASICSDAIRHLTPDGLVLISIPNGYGPYELEQRFLKSTGLGSLLSFARRRIGKLLRRPSSRVGKPVGGPAYNYDSGHVQFFHLRDFEKLLDNVGLRILHRSNGALFGGTLTSLLVGGIPLIVQGSLKVADWLPQRWVTTWYFCCSLHEPASRRGSAPATP